MLNIISAVSSIITCLLFIFYIIGHVWSYRTNKSFNKERFENISATNIDVSNATRAIVLNDVGTELSLTSSEGIRQVKVYNVEYSFKKDGSCKLVSRKLRGRYGILNPMETLYIMADLGETTPIVQVEILRRDYTVATFDLVESGKNGDVIPMKPDGVKMDKYKVKYGVRSLVYYLTR
ncbi:MAG: hypothetical protein ACI4D0_00045 [Lachnospira sp.]